MSKLTLQKKGCLLWEKTTGDENDIFVEKISISLLLFLAVLLVTASAVLVGYSAFLVIYRQQFLMEFLKTLIFAAPLLVIGSGLLHYLFRERKMRTRDRKRNPLGLTSPQPILCERCGAVLYDGRKIVSPYKIIESCNGRCPECGKELR